MIADEIEFELEYILKKLKTGVNEKKKKNIKENLIKEVCNLISEWEKIINKLKKISKRNQIQLAINSVFTIFNSTLDKLHKLKNLIHQYGSEDQKFYFEPPSGKIIKRLKENASALLNGSEGEAELLIQQNWQLFAHALAWSILLEFSDLNSQYSLRDFDFSLISDGSLAFQMLEFKDFLDKLRKILKNIKDAISKASDTDFVARITSLANEVNSLNKDFDDYKSIFDRLFQSVEEYSNRIYEGTIEIAARSL